MPIQGTKADLVEVLGGRTCDVDNQLQFSGIEFDSRKVQPGNIFVGLQGEACHGDTFAERAIEAGAALAVVEDSALLDGPCGGHMVVVKDTYQALTELAAWWRSQISARVIAVTGSAGKTTTKGLIAHLLSGYSKGTSAEKSFNNHIGVPYTICGIDRDDAWAVLEIGMNHAGEIETLSKLAQPDVALVTSIGPVHIGYFSSIEDIAREKLSITKGLKTGGELIMNSRVSSVVDDEKLALFIDGTPRLSTIGAGDKDTLTVSNIDVHGLEGVAFSLRCRGEKVELNSKLLGSVSCYNIGAAVLACMTAFPELELKTLCDRVAGFEPPPLRLNTIKVSGERIVIDDSYNANPISLTASLELLSALQKRGAVVGAILGDMLELGDFSEQYHQEIAQLAAGIPMSFIAAVGEHAGQLIRPSAENGVSAKICDSPQAAAEFAAGQTFDVVLVKASRGIALDKASAALADMLGRAA